MSETMTFVELERELKEARLRGAEDHTPVWIKSGIPVSHLDFTGSIRIQQKKND
jgi:hypothetical protein